MNPDTSAVLKPRRGRPPKVDRQFDDTRQALIRSGLEVLTETGYLAAGIDAVIKNIAVPKGSFYHCFKSKEAFGLAVLAAYGDFFAHKLDKFLLDDAVPPLPRRLTLTHSNGKRAILLIKEREKPAKAFTEEQMRLTLPEDVPLLPLSQYKAQ